MKIDDVKEKHQSPKKLSDLRKNPDSLLAHKDVDDEDGNMLEA